MKLGTSNGMPAIRFHPSRKPGNEACRICVTSWMKLPARYSASTATTPATIAQPTDGSVIASASAA